MQKYDSPHQQEDVQIQSIETTELPLIEEVTSSIIHEINNPISIITASSQVIKSLATNCPSQINQSENLDQGIKQLQESLLQSAKTIDYTVNRISKIISGMEKLVGKKELQDFEKININQIINQTLSLCSENIEHSDIHLEVINKVNDDITCNSIQISQILLNLLTNAIYAIENEQIKWIKIECSVSNNKIIIQVSDSGKGVPKEKLDSIFKPFYTTKPNGIGTGLGLSISSKIAKSHGGTLFYDSEQEHSTFILELPIRSNKSHS